MSSARLVGLLLRHRGVVALCALLLTLVAGYRTVKTYAALRSDLEELLPESAPSVAALAELRSRMPGLRYLGVVIDTGGPEHLPRANAAVDALAKRIETYPKDLVGAVRADVTREKQFVEERVLQLMDAEDVKRLREAVEKRRDWQVTRSMDLALTDDEEDPPPELPIDELKKKYEARHGAGQGMPSERFVSQDGRTAVLLVQASAQSTGYDADRALLSRVQADVKEIVPADMRVGYAGDVATRVEEMEGLRADLGMSGALVLALTVGVIVLFFRSARAVPILGIALGVGTLCSFAIVALPPLSIRHLNSNTAFLGSIVIGNGINSGIILLSRFWEERRLGAALEQALATAVAGTWKPTLAAALAAGCAYGSLVFTDFRGFNQFGWIGGLGMLVCWALNFLLIPPLAAWLSPADVPEMREGSVGSRFARSVIEHPKLMLAGTTLLLVVSAIGLERRGGDWIEYDLSQLRRRDSWETGERYWGKRMDDTLRRYLTPTVILADDVEQRRAIEARVKELAAEGAAGGLIGSVRTAEDVLRPDREKAIAEAKRLREVLTPKLRSELGERERQMLERALTDRALAPLTAAEIPDTLLAGLAEHDGRIDRTLLVFPKLDGGTWDATRIERFATDLRAAAEVDGKHAFVAGSLLLSSDIASAMRADGPRATAISLGLVILICAASFRAFGLSFAAVGGLLAGVVLMLGSLAWMGQKLNFSNFVALPITFGIAADYSINMLKRHQLEPGSLLRALTATGGAVTLCSLTTIIGFGSLLVAQNRALFSFGVFAVAGELTCLATAIVSLPAALAWFASRSREPVVSSPNEG